MPQGRRNRNRALIETARVLEVRAIFGTVSVVGAPATANGLAPRLRWLRDFSFCLLAFMEVDTVMTLRRSNLRIIVAECNLRLQFLLLGKDEDVGVGLGDES